MNDLTQMVGRCGLVCSLCDAVEKYQCVGCRKGGGPDADCFQLLCTLEKGIDGCWDCVEFPCDKGMFAATNSIAGICVAFVLCIKKNGIQAHLDHIKKNVGHSIFYADWQKETSHEILEVICRENIK